MQYDVRALTADHMITHLTVDAVDEEDARRQVEARGLFAAAINPARQGMLPIARSEKRQSRKLSLVLFSQELLALLNAGLNIVEGLEALLEKETSGAARSIMCRLLDGLRDGKRFSTALSEQPAVFPPLYIGIVRAAEGTSDLPRSLQRFIDYQQRIDAIRSKIISAAIYPSILMLVGGSVTMFLLGFVVPRFAEVYQGAGRDLPWLSQLMLDWGRLVGTHSTALLTAICTTVCVIGVSLHRFHAQGGMARLIALLPGVGDRARVYELSRLYLTLGMLLEGGIPVVQALDTAQGIVSSEIRKNVLAAKAAIEAGTPFSIAFETSHLTTPVSLRMLRVGERSGELGRMLTQSAAFYDGEITRWIDRFTRSFEPLLMTAIGVVVGLIVVLLYMPIFDLAGSLS